MSTKNPNMDDFQNSPQFQEAVKTAVDKALSDFFSENVVEKEEKSEGCPYLRPVSPPYWRTCTERDLSDPNIEKCVPPFWLMGHHLQNQDPSCFYQQQYPRHWNPPGRHFDGPRRYYDNSHCQQQLKDWSPWWSNRNPDGPGRFEDNRIPQQPPKEWTPWWSNRNAAGPGRFQDNSNPQQAPREWRPWWSNRNADESGRSGSNCSSQQEQKDWRPWWFNRNADGPSRSG